MRVRSMRIGVDATCWNSRRGYGRQLRSLLHAATKLDRQHRYVLFVDSPGESGYAIPAGAELVEVSTSVPTAAAASADGHRSAANLWAMGRAISRARVDAVFFPTVYSYVPVISPAVKLLMIHDVTAERLPEQIFPNRAARFRWQLKSYLGRRQADWILTVSEYSLQGIVKQFGVPCEKIRIVGEAPDPVFQPMDEVALPDDAVQRGVRPGSRLVTYVGGFGPHKNLLRLVEAFEGVAREPRFDDVQLVFVGEFSNDPFYSSYADLRRRLSGSAIEHRAVFTGFLPDDALVRLLNGSALAVLPSLMEGFGLPAVEAAACGLPVVATQQSPLPELLGDGVLAVDPKRAEDLQRAMVRLLEDDELRRGTGEQALRAAGRLSWEQAAGQWLGLLDEVGPVAK